MKIVGRILYAIVMVIFFLFTLNYSQELMTSLYFEDLGMPILEKEEVDYTFFYGSVPDFYLDEVVYTKESNGYELNIFEIAQVEEPSENQVFKPYYYIAIHSKEHLMEGTYTLEAISSVIDLQTNQYVTYIIDVVQFRQLNLFIGVSDLQTVYIDPILFTELPIEEIMLKKQDEILVSFNTSALNFDTTIDLKLNQFYQEENRMPSGEDMANQGVYPYHTHVMEDYSHVFIIAMVSYFIVLAVSTYFTFFFKPQRKTKKSDIIKKIEG